MIIDNITSESYYASSLSEGVATVIAQVRRIRAVDPTSLKLIQIFPDIDQIV